MKEETLNSRYLIQEQLCKRGGRETWLAKDIQTEELVVIKILKFGLDFQWEQLKLFEREAQTLQNINHPAIPKYLDYFEINAPEYRGFALVQTYIQAQSLAEQLDKGRTFTEAEVKQLAEQILNILIHLHSQNPPIIHRDLKPSNILLTNRSGNHVGDVYLIDFGSVQNVAAKQEGTITIVGTYGYMPPEQFGDRCVPASDLYSLGATLINLVTKIEPADLPQQDGIIRFEKLVNLSIQLKVWLKKTIEPSLDKRFTSAKVALDNLVNLSQSESKDLDVVELSDRQKFYLSKSAERLEVVIDLKITHSSLQQLIGFLFFIIFSVFAFMVFVYANNLSITFLSIFFTFLLPTIIIVSEIIPILSNEIGKKRIIIDRNRNGVTLTWEICLFGYQIVKPILTMNFPINKLETNKYSKQRFSRCYPTRPIGDKIILNKIVTEVFEIEDLNEAELNWLSRELSDWLQVPIEQR